MNKSKPTIWQSLNSLIDEDRLEDFIRLLDKNLDQINVKDEFFAQSLLHHVAYSGPDRFIRPLLERGADLELISGMGCTALVEAIRYHHFEKAMVLLHCGANPKAIWDARHKDGQKQSALHVAAGLPSAADLIKLMIAKGERVDARMPGNLTPLCVAAEEGLCDNILTLLMLGADPQHKAAKSRTPDQFARRHPEAAQLIRAWSVARDAGRVVDNVLRDLPVATGIRPLAFG